ncbi:MAG: histidine kinase [Bacteroidia bacterium]|nr:histidine kinase [Bacteroidia bacterium]
MRPKSIYVFVHLLIWAGAYYLLAPEPVGVGRFLLPVFSPRQNLWFITYGVLLNAAMIYTYAHLFLPRYLRKNNISYFFLINLVYLAGFVLLESSLDFSFVQYHHLQNPPDSWQSFTGWIETNTVLNVVFMLIANFYGFTFAWFQEQQNRRSLEQEKLKAELSALKHQINPHFLFNILNGLYGLAYQNDDEPTAEGIAKLSHLMRYMLYESNDNAVLLDKEIRYIENYIDLQRLRTQGAVEIDFSVTGEVQGKKIAPMILIPFVENAFKHGVSTAKPSVIRIRLDMMGNDLSFQVTNTIHRNESVSAPFGGIGLKNVEKRLDLLYKNAYKLEINPQNGFFQVNLTIAL